MDKLLAMEYRIPTLTRGLSADTELVHVFKVSGFVDRSR